MSEALQVIGGIAGALSAATALTNRDPRARAVALALSLVIALALVAAQAWDGELAALRDEPAKLAALLIAGALAIAILAALVDRAPALLPLGLIAMLPFRIPVDAGGDTSNLLIPLYLVVAAGAVLGLKRAFAGDGALPRETQRSRWVTLLLAASIVLYAIQAAYSSDVERATQNIAFFFIPFAAIFVMLRDADWTPKLLRTALLLVVAEGVVFALVGLAQHEARHIFWNDKAMESNEFDVEFRVNSLFWDPNIYGRYLALTIVVAVSALAWVNDARRFAAGVAATTVIFAGLFFSYSQTSTLALLAGIAVLCALRWSLRWTAAVCSGLAVAGLAAVLIAGGGGDGGKSGHDSGIDESSGRSELTSGGLDLAKNRPLAGYGSGSFAVEFAARHVVLEDQAAVSHTEPITIAAEQGAVGVLLYIGLLGAILALFLEGLRRISPGLGGKPDPGAVAIARIAVFAAGAGLFLHTLGYAGFLTDPLTWALLAVACTLGARTQS